MKNTNLILLFFFVSCFLYSCGEDKQLLHSKILPISKKQTLQYKVGDKKTLELEKGTKITFSENSILGVEKGTTIEVYAKEVFNVADMVANNILTKTTDGKLLETGGMVFLDVKDPNLVKINPNAPIEIALPSRNYKPEMKLYQGIEDKKNGQIVWKDSIPLNSDNLKKSIALGEKLFTANCSTCHHKNLVDISTGPSLWGVNKKVSYSWFRAFTKNSDLMISVGDKRALSIVKDRHWGQMSGYPVNDTTKTNDVNYEIEAIWNWIAFKSDSLTNPINSEGNRLIAPDDIPPYEVDEQVLDSLAQNISNSQDDLKLMQGANEFVKTNTIYNYMFSIKEWGWYNVDKLQDAGFSEVELALPLKNIPNNPSMSYNIYLIFENGLSITDLNISTDGMSAINGKEDNEKTTFLPIGEKAYVLGMAYSDNKFYSAKKNFVISSKNDFELVFKETTEEDIKKVIDKLK